MGIIRSSIITVAALTAYGGIFANAGNAAPAAGLLTGAPVVRTLAITAAKASVEKAKKGEAKTKRAAPSRAAKRKAS